MKCRVCGPRFEFSAFAGNDICSFDCWVKDGKSVELDKNAKPWVVRERSLKRIYLTCKTCDEPYITVIKGGKVRASQFCSRKCIKRGPDLYTSYMSRADEAKMFQRFKEAYVELVDVSALRERFGDRVKNFIRRLDKETKRKVMSIGRSAYVY